MDIARSARCMVAGVIGLLVVLAGAQMAAAVTYVVDQHHPKASDDNAGTANAPWKTVGKAATVAKAGDTVLVMEGTYDETVTPANPGEAGRPVVFKGLPRHKAQIKSVDTTNCPHLRIEGFRIVGGTVGVLIASDNVAVVDNDIEDQLKMAVNVNESALLTDKPVAAYIAFNTMSRCGKGVMSGGSRWVVERNDILRLINRKGGGDNDYTRPFGSHHIYRWNHMHGSVKEEIKTSHVDAFQVFDNNDYKASDTLIEENVCSEFHQGQMMETKYHPGNIKNFTFRRNIFFQRGKEAGWAGWGLCGSCPGMIADRNTFIDGNCSTRAIAVYTNNLLYGGYYYGAKDAPKNPNNRSNLIFMPNKKVPVTGFSHVPMPYDKDLLNVDPLFVDLATDNVRLKKGSPAIGAGDEGVCIGALDYPNVYYVDARHPGASDTGWGYPGAPFKTVSKALSVAQPGETIVLRSGVYRETIVPKVGGLTIKGAEGDEVIVSGADLVGGWTRDAVDPNQWQAPLAAKPKRLLRDGIAWNDFEFDAAKGCITVRGFDPRMHVFETVVRNEGLDTSACKDIHVEGIEVRDVLAAQ